MTGDALCLPQRNLFCASVKEAHAFLLPLLRFIGLELGPKNVTGEPTFASSLASKEQAAHRHAGRLLKSAYPSTAMISFAIQTVAIASLLSLATLRNARYCQGCGSGIDSCSGRSASAQPSVPSGYQTTLAYPRARIRFAAFHDIQQSRRQ
jgi:hypothetical protein